MQSISDSHRKQLADSAISDEVIAERGYWTATTKTELRQLGFSASQQNVPTLVIPIRDVHRETSLYQCRPDVPRIVKGKAVKYETPHGAGLVLDVPARVRDQLDNPTVPLWITEGSKKVDSAVTHGLACIGVIGVYGFRTTNQDGGKVALPDLEYIAWNERKVYLAFDSDVMEKPQVHEALRRLADILKSRAAHVLYVYIPTPDGRKMGLDDFLADGGTVTDLLSTATDTLRRVLGDEVDDKLDTLPEPTPEAQAAALVLLDSEDLLERADAAVVALGHAGDTFLRKLVYLVLVSRLLARPLNLVVSGPSSAGKSFLVNLVCKLFPSYAAYHLSAMSERVLAYTSEDLRHRYLIIGEATALHRDGIGASLLRGMVWDGQVSYEYVDKSPDGLVSRRIEKPGPTGFITTTTGQIEAELETRVLTVHVSDTPETTRLILRASAGRANGHAPEPPDLEEWHAVAWWLQEHGNRDVDIPYAHQLAEAVPNRLVRMRRDFTQILTLIQSHALLYQRQRDRTDDDRIIADHRDYEAVFRLVADVFGAIAAEGVTPATRETVAKVVELTPNPTDSITITRLAREMQLDRSAVKKRVAKALAGEWIVNTETREKQPLKLRGGDPLPLDRPALPLPEEVFNDARAQPPIPSEFPSSLVPDVPHVEAKTLGKTGTFPSSSPVSPVDATRDTGEHRGKRAYSLVKPHVEAENRRLGNKGTQEDTGSVWHTIEADIRAWLQDGTLALLATERGPRDLVKDVRVWLRHSDDAHSGPRARQRLAETHAAVTAFLEGAAA